MESLSDPCVFLKKEITILVYVDDCIIISKNTKLTDEFIESITNSVEKFKLTNEGTLASYLGVEIT